MYFEHHLIYSPSTWSLQTLVQERVRYVRKSSAVKMQKYSSPSCRVLHAEHLLVQQILMCNFGGINLIEYLPGGKIVNSAAAWHITEENYQFCRFIVGQCYTYLLALNIFLDPLASLCLFFDAEAKSSLSAVMPQEDPFSII